MQNSDIRWFVDRNHSTSPEANPWLPEPRAVRDPSFGYTIEDLLNISPLPQLPVGGEAYWRARYERVLQMKLKVTWEDDWTVIKARKVRKLRIETPHGRTIGAWFSVPAEGEVTRLVVHGNGYGAATSTSDLLLGGEAHLLLWREIVQDGQNLFELPVTHGIENRDTFILGGRIEDVWCAVTAMRSLYPDPALPLYYWGGSFGGGIGALAIPWDDRVEAAYFDVPTFGNHPLRMTTPCIGLGRFLLEYYQQHPEVLDVLQWYDAAATIVHAKQPVLYACAILDHIVTPAGQFSIWHAHRGRKRLLVLPAGHLNHPNVGVYAWEVLDEVKQWFQRG
jgi:cephalosporin-C deacetylase